MLLGLATIREQAAYVFVLQMLEQFQFSIRSLRQDRRAERLHYLLDSHGLSCELIFGRATCLLVHALSSLFASFQIRTIRVQKLPCPLAADRYICAGQSFFPHLCTLPRRCLRISCHEPAGDLERRAEDLGTYEFRHSEGCVARDSSVWEVVF